MVGLREGLKWTLIVGATLLVVLAGVFFFLTETHRGQRWVLKEVLERLEGTIDGRITVEDIRSEGLLRGAVLHGVRVTSLENEPFFYADSTLLRYSARTFLTGDVVFSRVEVWDPVVHIEKMPWEDRFNADRIFRTPPDEEPEEPPGPPRLVEMDRVRIHSGTVLVRYPAKDPPPDRAILEPIPGSDEMLRRLEFEEIIAVLPEVRISGPGIEGPVVEVATVGMLGRIFEEPFRVRHMKGLVEWAESRLTVRADTLDLPGSRFMGDVVADFSPDEGVEVLADLTSPRLAFRDLQWLDPRVPEGEGRLSLEVRISPDGNRWSFRELDAVIEESRVAATGVLNTRGSDFSFDGMELELAPLALRRVEEWLPESFPKRGMARGNLTLDGTVDRLRSRGRVTLDLPDASPTTARYAGVFHLDEPFGFTDLEATLDPLDYAVIGRFLPEFRLTGPGRAQVTATGRIGQGIRFTADLAHRPPGLESSRVAVSGRVREGPGGLVLSLDGDLQPLNLTALAEAWPDLPVQGVVSGQVTAEGPLTDLRLETDLDTPAGALDVVARLNVRDPAAGYFVEGDVADFRVSELLTNLPEPTILNGYVFVEGRGGSLAALNADVRLRVHDSRIGDLEVDTAWTVLRAASGRLRIDTLDARIAGADLQGAGDLALTGAEPSGEVRLRFATESVEGFRPLLLGRDLIARDTLTAVDREVLMAAGVDPDTLPTTDEIELSGAVSGEVVLRGAVSDFSAEGEARFDELRYGTNFIREGEVDFFAESLPGLEGDFRVSLVADSVGIADRRFAGADLDLEYRAPSGRFDLQLVRSEAEDYRARAAFQVDTLGGEVQVEELALRFDDALWILADTAVVAWTDTGLRVENLELVREGEEDGLRLTAEGLIPREGPADFRLRIDELPLERLARLLQADTVPVEGLLDLDLRVQGTAAAPEVLGTIAAEDVRYDEVRLDRVAGDVAYRDERLQVDLDAWRDDLPVMEVEGFVPVELSLSPFRAGLLDEEMDLHVNADSLPADLALGLVGDMRDIEGRIGGQFHLHGTPNDVSPSGTVELVGGAFTLRSVGVRYTDVTADLALEPDGMVDVDASARAGGRAVVTGTIQLDTLTNPRFDLSIALSGFRAVQRRDVAGTVDGLLQLQRRYRSPFLTGDVRVTEGVLQLEEFTRTATVVDLSDPAFFDVVDTTLVAERRLVEGEANPFLRHLRADIDLTVERGVFLRGRGINVEMAGDLDVTYDRLRNDFVLIGQLEAVRGTYTLYGRTFDVQSGQVEFVGTPGMNPNLDITAVARVGGPQGDPLGVFANLQGTLANPEVTISSDAAGQIAESDLVSYLIFGRPSYELAQGQQAAIGAATGAVEGLLVGSLAQELGQELGSVAGADFITIRQTQGAGLLRGDLVSSFAQSVIEAGWYIDEDFFLVVLVRPLASMAQTSGNVVGGARLDYRFGPEWTAEAFWEDRFLRGGTIGFGLNNFQVERVAGLSVFREWGY